MYIKKDSGALYKYMRKFNGSKEELKKMCEDHNHIYQLIRVNNVDMVMKTRANMIKNYFIVENMLLREILVVDRRFSGVDINVSS